MGGAASSATEWRRPVAAGGAARRPKAAAQPVGNETTELPSAIAEGPVKVVREVRVDSIGYVGELVKQHADVLKTKVKVRMLDDELERVTGDAFEGLLVQGKSRTLDPKKL